MEAIENIKTRRSIRKYTSQVVSDKIINELLECAMLAPSAGNRQPWHFVVITERETLNTITEFHPHSFMLKGASVAILVCGDLEKELHKGYWVQDCSAATQNLLLAAHAKDLGAVWLGIYPNEERIEKLSRMTKLPDKIVPLALVSIGYPDEEPQQPDRFKEEKVHQENW